VITRVSIFRPPRPDSHVRVLEKCDKAIDRAVKSRKTVSEEADHYFEAAIRRLKDYDVEFHHR
jgi:hypothetical protein